MNSHNNVTQVVAHHSELVHGFLNQYWFFNPIVLRKAKIACNFGLSECNRVKVAKNSRPNSLQEKKKNKKKKKEVVSKRRKKK